MSQGYRIALFTTCLAPLLGGCMPGPDHAVPDIPYSAEWASRHATISAQTQPDAAWWKHFDDPVLSQIMEEAASRNLDARIAMANIERARALRQVAVAGFFPQLGASIEGTRQGFSEATSRNRILAEQERDTFNTALDAGWELDFFGRIRRGSEAATARLQASEEDRRDILLSALAETAESYFTVRGLQKRLEVLRHNIQLQREVEDIARFQYEAGIVTQFDYTTAMGERQRVEAGLPLLESDLAAAIHRLSVLAGHDPQYYTGLLARPDALPPPPDLVPIGLRSELLRRRPDIRRAERELAAANAEIGVAIAERFPRISLTGMVGTAAYGFGDLFIREGLNHAYGGILSLPLFEGGAGIARVEAGKASHKAAWLNYEKAVLSALEEAETSLIRYGNEWKTLNRLRSAEEQRQEAYRIARSRYEAGQENFLVMLDAERSLVSAQDETVQSETRILLYLTQLYKALGGGWQVFEPEAAIKASEATAETTAAPTE